MSEQTRELVVVITHSAEHELASVGYTIACGGMTSGLVVSIFLTSGGVDTVRKRAADLTEFQPLSPLKALIDDFLARGGKLYACTPCVRARGYQDSDLMDGVVVTGASVMHEAIKRGAATLSF